MLVDDTYFYIKARANEVAYSLGEGEPYTEALLDRWCQNIVDQLIKLQQCHGLALAHMPDA